MDHLQVSNLILKDGRIPKSQTNQPLPGQKFPDRLNPQQAAIKPRQRNFLERLYSQTKHQKKFTTQVLSLLDPTLNKSKNAPNSKSAPQPAQKTTPQKVTQKTFEESFRKHNCHCLTPDKRQKIIQTVNQGPYEIKSWQAENLAEDIIKKQKLSEFGRRAVRESLGLPTKK